MSRRFGRMVLRVPEGPLRFLLAGGVSSLLNWLVRFPLSLVLPFELAVAVAYAIGMALGFWLYRIWVFPGSALPLAAQALRFAAVNAAGFAVVVGAAKVMLVALSWNGLLPVPLAEALSHGLAIAAGAVVNFLGHRAVTFARRSAVAPRPRAAISAP